MKISVVYPKISDMTPMMTPMMHICDDLIRPVEYAMAFGGVLMGRAIANDAESAIPINNVPIPPYSSSMGPIPFPTAARIGIIRAAAAEFEINVDNNQQMTPLPTNTSRTGQSVKGIDSTRVLARPVLSIPTPSANPPATIHSTAQSISFKSFDFIILVRLNTPTGISATIYELIPVSFSNIHNAMVTASVI